MQATYSNVMNMNMKPFFKILLLIIMLNVTHSTHNEGVCTSSSRTTHIRTHYKIVESAVYTRCGSFWQSRCRDGTIYRAQSYNETYHRYEEVFGCCTGYINNGSQNCEPICNPLCQNGGTCSSPGRCTCRSGYTGSRCQNAICSPPCENGGNCSFPDTCSCDTARYSGLYCQIPVCTPRCRNGGICSSPGICNCTLGYSGSRCENAICNPACQNGGTCSAPDTCNCITTHFSGSHCQHPNPVITKLEPRSDVLCPHDTVAFECKTSTSVMYWNIHELNQNVSSVTCVRNADCFSNSTNKIPYMAVANLTVNSNKDFVITSILTLKLSVLTNSTSILYIECMDSDGDSSNEIINIPSAFSDFSIKDFKMIGSSTTITFGTIVLAGLGDHSTCIDMYCVEVIAMDTNSTANRCSSNQNVSLNLNLCESAYNVTVYIQYTNGSVFSSEEYSDLIISSQKQNGTCQMHVSKSTGAGAYGLIAIVLIMIIVIAVVLIIVGVVVARFKQRRRKKSSNRGPQSELHNIRNIDLQQEKIIRPANRFETQDVESKFKDDWSSNKGECPSVERVFVIENQVLKKNWKIYQKTLTNKGKREYYHGTRLVCDITNKGDVCSNSECGICAIAQRGFNRDHIGTNISYFARFGRGFYLAPNSSKSHDYTQGAYEYRAMLRCDVSPGNKYVVFWSDQNLAGPPDSYDSIYGEIGGDLNYKEIIVSNADAIYPAHIIVYKKDGTDKLIH